LDGVRSFEIEVNGHTWQRFPRFYGFRHGFNKFLHTA